MESSVATTILPEDTMSLPPRAALAFNEDLNSELDYDQAEYEEEEETDTDPDTEPDTEDEDGDDDDSASSSGRHRAASSGSGLGSESHSSIAIGPSRSSQSTSATSTVGSHVYLQKMKRFQDNQALAAYVRRLPVFSILHALFFTSRIFLGDSVGVGQIALGDVFGLLAPLVLVPVIFDLFVNCKPVHVRGLKRAESILFIAAVAVFAQGSGIQLSSHAIGRPLGEGDRGNAEATFWEEDIGHVWPYLGLFAIHSLLLWSQYRLPFFVLIKANDESKFGLFQRRYRALVVITVAAGVIHGFAFFLNVVEGQFGWPGFVFNMLNIAFQCYLLATRCFKNSPLYLFSLVFNAVAAVCTLSWLGVQGGSLPQFSAAGLI